MLWVTNTIVVPVSRQMRSSSSLRRSRVISSIAPKGSSISRMRGPPRSARAMATRCRMPPDNWCGSACSQPVRPTRRALSLTPLASGGKAERAPTSSGSRTLSMTLRHGSKVASWNTNPICRRRRAASAVVPSTRTSPDCGRTMSAMTRNSVDLPQPDGPSTVSRLPAATVSETPSSAVTDWRLLTKRTRTPSHCSAGADDTDPSPELRPSVGGRLQDLRRHHLVDRWGPLRKLAEVAPHRDLLLPDHGVHRAVAVGAGMLVEAVVQHHIRGRALVSGDEVREDFEQEADSLVAIAVRVIPTAPGGPQETGQQVATFGERFDSGVVRVGVEAHARVPQPQGDAIRPEHRKSGDIGEPPGDDIHLAGQQRRHVRSDRDDLNLARIDPILGHQRAQQDHTRCLNADPLAGEIGGVAHRVFRQRKKGVGVLLRRYGDAFDRQILRHRQHQGWACRNLTDLVSPGCYDGDAIIIRPARL